MLDHLFGRVPRIGALGALGRVGELLYDGPQLVHVVPGDVVAVLVLGELEITDWAAGADALLLGLGQELGPL